MAQKKQDKGQKPKTKRLTPTILNQVQAVGRGLVISRLTGLGLLADSARSFVDTTLQQEKASVRDPQAAFSGLRSTMLSAATDVRAKLLEIPGKMFDSFSEELHSDKESSETESSKP